LKGLQKFTKYEVNVAAQSEYGTGPFSNLTTFTTLEDTPTNSPQNVTGYPINSTAVCMRAMM
jgi:hypothetical protein